MIALGEAWPLLLAAPAAGSLAGVLVRRLPAGRPVALARSRCDGCGRALGARDLVPLLSYAAAGGRCRRCRAPIGAFYPAIELAALAVGLWAVLATDDAATGWQSAALGWGLLTLSWIDWEHLLLPDAISVPLILGGLFVAWWRDPASLLEHGVAVGFGYGAIWGIAAAYRKLRGRDGIGLGDAMLLAAAGAWVGIGGLPSVVLIAALMGLGLAAVARFGGRRIVDGAIAVPFGPCLSAGIWFVWLYDPARSGCCVASWDD